MHPAPLVTHPVKKVSHSVSEVAVVLSVHYFKAQAEVAVAAAEFQHLYDPFVPLKASHCD